MLSDLSLASARGRAHIAVDVVSKSLLLSLKAGDVISMSAHGQTFLYSDDHNLVSLTGNSLNILIACGFLMFL